jgi:hypothetical protein
MPPDLRQLERDLLALRQRPELRGYVDPAGRIDFSTLTLDDLAALLADPTASLLLMAAADLNRTALRSGIQQSHAQIVAPALRRAFVVQSKLPPHADFDALVALALQRRAGTLGRNSNAVTETLVRDRLAFEGSPIRMRGGYTSGLLITRRKPDGVYPDPATGLAPTLYLEIKKINRPRDDIQKRLYEIAEVSLEVKFLYGDLRLHGMSLPHLLEEDERPAAQARLRQQITAASPVVVALLLTELEHVTYLRRYRSGIEAFVDRVFFADEIDECLSFLGDVAPPTVIAE